MRLSIPLYSATYARIFTLIIVLVLSILLNAAHASSLPVAKNFTKDAELLGEQRILVVMISQSDCSYCHLIHDDFLAPMHQGGLYQQKVLFRELKIDSNTNILGFNGEKITPKQFAQKYQATLTPTLLFLDGKGSALVPNMIGVNTPEFYGYYLDESIDKAIIALQQHQ